MATITKSIGTASRDYSTITAWEAALGGAAGGAGNDAVGEAYNDSAFDEAVTINDATPSSIALTVASEEMHDGTAGTGARIVRTTSTATIRLGGSSVFPMKCSWMEVDANGRASTSFQGFLTAQTGFTGNECTFERCIVHGGRTQTSAGIYLSSSAADLRAMNCIVYDCDGQSGYTYAGAGAIVLGVWPHEVFNLTVHNVSGRFSCGLDMFDALHIARNLVISDTTIGDDYNPTGSQDHNISTDATATGTGSLTNQSAASLFISVVPGSEDLHLKPGSPAIGAGANLGVSPEGVNFDIDNYDRSLAAAWDIGADQFVAVQTSVSKQFLQQRTNATNLAICRGSL